MQKNNENAYCYQRFECTLCTAQHPIVGQNIQNLSFLWVDSKLSMQSLIDFLSVRPILKQVGFFLSKWGVHK